MESSVDGVIIPGTNSHIFTYNVGSMRADGTMRPSYKVKPGYVPPHLIKTYVPPHLVHTFIHHLRIYREEKKVLTKTKRKYNQWSNLDWHSSCLAKVKDLVIMDKLNHLSRLKRSANIRTRMTVETYQYTNQNPPSQTKNTKFEWSISANPNSSPSSLMMSPISLRLGLLSRSVLRGGRLRLLKGKTYTMHLNRTA
jgi:hypothetical protein